MTLEELKTEAKRQGYNLIPIPKPKPKMMPCPVCGATGIDGVNGLAVLRGRVESLDGRPPIYFKLVECSSCGFCGPNVIGDSDEDAIIGWNQYLTNGKSYWGEFCKWKMIFVLGIL